MPDLFLGTWDLIPELSLYAAGSPPAAGRYTIAAAPDGTLQLSIAWQPAGSESWQQLGFGGPADGTPQPLPGASLGAPDRFTLTRVDGRTLDSAAHSGEECVAWARRAASADGALLSVVQELRTADGSRVRNFQVYRRVPSR